MKKIKRSDRDRVRETHRPPLYMCVWRSCIDTEALQQCDKLYQNLDVGVPLCSYVIASSKIETFQSETEVYACFK